MKIYSQTLLRDRSVFMSRGEGGWQYCNKPFRKFGDPWVKEVEKTKTPLIDNIKNCTPPRYGDYHFVPKAQAQNAMIKGHCLFQLGFFGCCKPLAGPGQSPVGGPGDKDPGSSSNSVFYSTKMRSVIKVHIFQVL